jgi:uncharacterized lipoprotein YddW (UPF0748 family)
MSFAGSTVARRAAAALAIALVVCAAPVTAPRAVAVVTAAEDQAYAAQAFTPAGAAAAPRTFPNPTDETRALWVLRTSLATPASIVTLVRSAREHGFNTLLVQVRGRGDAYFRGGIEPHPPELLRQPLTFDPLSDVVEQAHAAGLRVHAWVNVNLVSSAADLPKAREHVVYRHPAWLMIPRDIAQELATIEPASPAYLGKLARWTRSQSAEVEGIYSSPIVPEAAAHTEAIVRDLTRRYPVDGIHFDYARYPNERFDYSRPAIREFRTYVRPRIDEARRRALDGREADDLFAYPDGLPDHWRAFRIARMTALMTRLRDAVKAERPEAMVTVAAAPDLREAYERRLQDWRGWLERGVIDGVCPMAYTMEPARFAEQIAAAREAAGGRILWAGIGAWRLSARETVENIQTARRLGASGIILFSYDSLTNPRQTSPGYLENVSRSAFAAGVSHGSK